MQHVMNSARNAMSGFKKGKGLNYLTDNVLSARYIIFELAKLKVKFNIKNYGLSVRRITIDNEST